MVSTSAAGARRLRLLPCCASASTSCASAWRSSARQRENRSPDIRKPLVMEEKVNMKDKAGGMLVEVVVKLKVADRPPRSRFSEARLEQEAVDAVAACLAKERAIKFKEASLLELDQGKRGFEGGIPLDCGLSERVRLHPDGSWSYPYPEGNQKS